MISNIDNNLSDFDDSIIDTLINNSIKLTEENDDFDNYVKENLEIKISIPRTISYKNMNTQQNTKLKIPRTISYEKMDMEECMWIFDDFIINQYNDDFVKEDTIKEGTIKEDTIKEDTKTKISKRINEAKLTSTSRLNTSKMFEDFNCYCCKNYLTIHDNNVSNYLIKYDTMNKTVTPRSSKSIIALYKLRPDLFINQNINNYKFLRNFEKKSCITDQSYEFRYEIWVYDKNNKDTIIMCSICDKELCQFHYQYNPFHNKKCKFCEKFWSICSCCIFDEFYENFIISDFFHEEVFCEILHK